MNCPLDAGCICIAINITELHSKQPCPIGFYFCKFFFLGVCKQQRTQCFVSTIEASLNVSVTSPHPQAPWVLQTDAALDSGGTMGPVLPAVLGEEGCISLRVLSVDLWLYILHFHPLFILPDAASISSIQKIGLHPYPPHRESARLPSVFHLSASLYFITLHQCLLSHGSVHTHGHCFADGVGNVHCFCHFIIWEAKVSCFAFSPLKMHYAAKMMIT